MNERSNTEQLDFAVLVPLAQSGDSRAVNRLLLGFTPMVRAFKYNSYYVHFLEQEDTEIFALMAVNDAIMSFRHSNFHFFTSHVRFTIRRQLNLQVQKQKLRLDCEQATLNEERSLTLDTFAADRYSESTRADELSAGLRELLAQLPRLQRLVLSEVFLAGKSQREVAAALGITCQSVFCSKRDGLAKLRLAYGVDAGGLH